MASTLRSSRLRARLYDTPSSHAATRRDLALEYTRLCPRDISGWALLANALIDLTLYSKARVALRRVEEIGRAEHSYVARVCWGRYYKAMGDLKRAERWYRRAAGTAPVALVFLGAVLAKQGKLAEAKQLHRQATRAPEDTRIARD